MDSLFNFFATRDFIVSALLLWVARGNIYVFECRYR